MSDETHPDANNLWAKAALMPMHKQCACDWQRNPDWTKKTRLLIQQFRADPGFMAALIGPRGTGKTQAAVEVMRAACKAGKPALYCTAMDFFAKIKATYGNQEKSESAVIVEFAAPQLLVIDEVQVRSESLWENNLLTHLVDRRYGYLRGTIFIGNLGKGTFLDCVGDSIHSRLAQKGGIHNFTGMSSWRQTA